MPLIKKLSVRLQNHPKRLIYPDGEDIRVIKAARQFATRKLGVPILLLAIAIALSRLYVGVHYPLDVFGGIVIGGAMAFLVNTIANRIQDSRYPGKH